MSQRSSIFVTNFTGHHFCCDKTRNPHCDKSSRCESCDKSGRCDQKLVATYVYMLHAGGLGQMPIHNDTSTYNVLSNLWIVKLYLSNTVQGEQPGETLLVVLY